MPLTARLIWKEAPNQWIHNGRGYGFVTLARLLYAAPSHFQILTNKRLPLLDEQS